MRSGGGSGRPGRSSSTSRRGRTRPGSVLLLEADLHLCRAFPDLIARILAFRGRLDILINNASSFYPTPFGQVSEDQWDDLLASNLKGPFFLAQAAASLLRATRGAPFGEAFAAGLPVAGRSGTLALRMTGTSTAGRVHAKTGSIAASRALSGYATTLQGHDVTFSIIVSGPTADAERRIDAFATALVERL